MKYTKKLISIIILLLFNQSVFSMTSDTKTLSDNVRHLLKKDLKTPDQLLDLTQKNKLESFLKQAWTTNQKDTNSIINEIVKIQKKKVIDQKKRIDRHCKHVKIGRIATTAIVTPISASIIFLLIFRPTLYTIVSLTGDYRYTHSTYIMNISIAIATILSLYLAQKLANTTSSYLFPR